MAAKKKKKSKAYTGARKGKRARGGNAHSDKVSRAFSRAGGSSAGHKKNKKRKKPLTQKAKLSLSRGHKPLSVLIASQEMQAKNVDKLEKIIQQRMRAGE